MRAAQAGDRIAYAALLEDASALVTRLLQRRLADPRDVEDVRQETLLALHRARHSYDPSRPFEPWLAAIAAHALADHLRRRHRVRREILVAIPPDAAAECDGAAELGFAQALARLPALQREAFALIQLKGLSVQTAAVRVSASASALKVRAHRAYRSLRDSLRR
jgi:RNA polymerase sigma-70 factor (ECF subfamily)